MGKVIRIFKKWYICQNTYWLQTRPCTLNKHSKTARQYSLNVKRVEAETRCVKAQWYGARISLGCEKPGTWALLVPADPTWIQGQESSAIALSETKPIITVNSLTHKNDHIPPCTRVTHSDAHAGRRGMPIGEAGQVQAGYPAVTCIKTHPTNMYLIVCFHQAPRKFFLCVTSKRECHRG